MHNIIVADDIDLFGHTTEWIESVQDAARKYRTLVGKYDGVGVDDGGQIVPPEEGTKLYPTS